MIFLSAQISAHLVAGPNDFNHTQLHKRIIDYRGLGFADTGMCFRSIATT
jgi:hypothetical protein